MENSAGIGGKEPASGTILRQQVMRDGNEKREEKRKIPLCARSEVVKIKYPRTCPIHIICALTSFTVLRPRFSNAE
jgi:hypothetical protein